MDSTDFTDSNYPDISGISEIRGMLLFAVDDIGSKLLKGGDRMPSPSAN
jgi:hypothetical protein